MCSTTCRPTPLANDVSTPTWVNPARVRTLAEPVLCSATLANSGLAVSIRKNLVGAAEARPSPHRAWIDPIADLTVTIYRETCNGVHQDAVVVDRAQRHRRVASDTLVVSFERRSVRRIWPGECSHLKPRWPRRRRCRLALQVEAELGQRTG
jgi:hypothetical protein